MTDVVEGRIAVPGGEVWYRRMGRGGVPLVLVHGGPGFPGDILFEAFEPLAAEREVIWYDQLGVGRSDPIEDPALLTVDRFLDELGTVIAGLDLQRPHVYGHSWGAMLGLQYAAERAPDWTSLVCASGMASIPRFCAEVRELMAKLPGNVLDRVYGRELAGETADPDYQAALGEFMQAHVLRNPQPPASWTEGIARGSLLTFTTMAGHGDHHVSGTLKDWDIFEELHQIRVPTLVLGGEFDESVPSHLADIASRIPNSEHCTQPGATHLPYIEETPMREAHVAIVQDYLARTEAACHA
ncbi:proline iminopeptidase-family hydrolase [Amycolatopsis jejuensis]|uniref:proline iminopeptidase-family hydrolase n=1 Tax=Amycolatopsis jejuensis TaxID=330084 RepID=UPI000526F65A|nr:proline iminopeptidase-family hydrolase [Amycolatopsis jejuensis]